LIKFCLNNDSNCLQSCQICYVSNEASITLDQSIARLSQHHLCEHLLLILMGNPLDFILSGVIGIVNSGMVTHLSRLVSQALEPVHGPADASGHEEGPRNNMARRTTKHGRCTNSTKQGHGNHMVDILRTQIGFVVMSQKFKDQLIAKEQRPTSHCVRGSSVHKNPHHTASERLVTN